MLSSWLWNSDNDNNAHGIDKDPEIEHKCLWWRRIKTEWTGHSSQSGPYYSYYVVLSLGNYYSKKSLYFF